MPCRFPEPAWGEQPSTKRKTEGACTSQNGPMSSADIIEEELGELMRAHGFQLGRATDDAVEYVKYPLTLYATWGHGELGVVFFVDIEFTVDHPVFKPFLTRTFDLEQVARAAGAPREPVRGGAAEYVTTEEQARACMRRARSLLKRHLSGLLDGDLSLLETITRKNSGSS